MKIIPLATNNNSILGKLPIDHSKIVKCILASNVLVWRDNEFVSPELPPKTLHSHNDNIKEFQNARRKLRIKEDLVWVEVIDIILTELGIDPNLIDKERCKDFEDRINGMWYAHEATNILHRSGLIPEDKVLPYAIDDITLTVICEGVDAVYVSSIPDYRYYDFDTETLTMDYYVETIYYGDNSVMVKPKDIEVIIDGYKD